MSVNTLFSIPVIDAFERWEAKQPTQDRMEERCFENLFFFFFPSRSVDVLEVIISRWMLAADRVGALCC